MRPITQPVARPMPSQALSGVALPAERRRGTVPDPHGQAMAKIRIEGLYKTYASKGGRVTALEQVDLTIKQNEFITLVGPSGCGKSTLLKLMGALIRPSRGVLLYDGAPLSRPPRDIGMVFQEAVLLQ